MIRIWVDNKPLTVFEKGETTLDNATIGETISFDSIEEEGCYDVYKIINVIHHVSTNELIIQVAQL